MNADECLNLISQIIAPDSYEQDVDEGKTSGKSLYYTSDMGVVTRVPNHRAYHRTFQDRETKFGLPSRIFSVVFEDEQTTGNNVLRHPRRKQFVIHEYVYPLWQKGRELEEWEIRKIAKAIINSGNGTFEDPTGKALYLPRISQNPPQNPNSKNNIKGIVPKNKRNKNKKNMKKVKQIKESQLRAIVAESVRRVLREKSENDWRQYAEKAIQCAQRGDYENASKYDNLAASALKGKYGLGDSQFETNFDDYKGKQQYYRSRSLGSHNPYDGIPVDTYSKSLDGNSKRNWKRTSGLLPTNAENDLNDYFSN